MATYYTATTGNDSTGDGSFGDPWKSWYFSMGELVAGDILYILSGTYTETETTFVGVRCTQSGTSGSHITVEAYDLTNRPILDCSALTGNGQRYGIQLDGCDYWDIKGLIQTDCYDNTTYDAAGWAIVDCTHMNFEYCVCRESGNGFSYGGDNDYIAFINCDSYQLYDDYDSGGLANGFSTNGYSDTHTSFVGCRAWLCSDDGWDSFSNWGGIGYITYTNCWAFENGTYAGRTGNGAGFKGGMTFSAADTGVIQRQFINCVAFDNTGYGYDESQDAGEDAKSIKHVFYNCTSYNNATGWNFNYGAGSDSNQEVDVFRNCVSHDETVGTIHANNDVDYCSWQDATVTDADFVSVTSSEAKAARQSNGDLPVIEFLHLASDSDMRGIGIAVSGVTTDCDGETYLDPPSLGAWEYVVSGAGIPYPFSLQDVVDYIDSSLTSLQACFDNADSDAFDPAYEGDRDRLSNFRNYGGTITYGDWALPSKDELAAMYTNLHAESLGGFASAIYWASSETDASNAYARNFSDDSDINDNKTYSWYVRACRSFTASAGLYAVEDVGPGGGYVFYASGTSYIEAYPTDQSTGSTWSNITSTAVTGTGTAIGTGEANTALIIGQAGHTASAAKLCDDLN